MSKMGNFGDTIRWARPLALRGDGFSRRLRLFPAKGVRQSLTDDPFRGGARNEKRGRSVDRGSAKQKRLPNELHTLSGGARYLTHKI